jgi:hypothetical protein
MLEIRGLGEGGGRLPVAWFWQDPAVVLPPGSSQTDGGNPVQGNQTFPPILFFG